MKNLFMLLLTLALAVSLCACGNSEKAAAMETQINALGEITLSSEKAIEDAEKAWAALTEEDRRQVENQNLLTEARSTYDHMVLSEEAGRIDAAILKIDTLESGKKDAVLEAQELYEDASAEIQALVTAKDKLDTYVNNLDAFQLEDAEALISAIGEVTLTSKDSIIAAKIAYYQLPKDLRAQVTNAELLNSASKTFLTLNQDTAEDLLSHMRSFKNPSGGMSYMPEAQPWADETSVASDQRCFFAAYLVHQNNGSCKPHILANYTGDITIGFNEIHISADEKQYTLAVNPFGVEKGSVGESFWEQIDLSVGENETEILRSIAGSETATVQFKGYKREHTFTVPDADKQLIADVLKAYECLDASYAVMHPGA